MTADQFKQIVPSIKAVNLEKYLPQFAPVLTRYDITTPIRIAPFIAQVAHESVGFNYCKEIASGAAYEGRRDLGNTQTGDGVKFKGRGLIQITGRSNYRAVSKAFFGDERLLTQPEILEQPQYALQSACWYWKDRGLNFYADQSEAWRKVWKGKQYDKFQWITIKINGGLNGYADRLRYYERAKKVFGLW